MDPNFKSLYLQDGPTRYRIGYGSIKQFKTGKFTVDEKELARMEATQSQPEAPAAVAEVAAENPPPSPEYVVPAPEETEAAIPAPSEVPPDNDAVPMEEKPEVTSKSRPARKTKG